MSFTGLKPETVIRLNKFAPRDYQLPICKAIASEGGGFKKLLCVLPRRAGKDILMWNLMIRAAIKQVGNYFYCLPTFAQARSVIWDSITNTGQKFVDFIPPELIAKKLDNTMQITLINGSQIKLIGSDSYDTSIIGTNPRMIVFSEYALADENAYKLAALPILRANGGTVCLISTPRGKNHMYELYQIAQNSPDWFTYFRTVEDTQHINLDEIKREIASGEMSADMARQEYFCFPAGQHVLTSVGSRPIELITPDEMVVSHSGRLRKVLGVISREYSGKLYEIHSYGSSEPIVCTPNHPIRVYERGKQKYTWKNAEDIDNEDRLVFPKMTLGKTEILSINMIELIAWYITEGSSFKNGVQFTVKEKESYKIIPLLIALHIEFEQFQGKGCVNIVVYSVQFVDFFKSTCGTQANNKRIPFHLIAGYEEEFFDILMQGDGCHNISNGHEKYTYTTVSKTLAYQVQLLANSLNLGYAAGISKREAYEGKIEGRKVNCQESYQVNISFPGLKRKGGKLLRAKNSIAAIITQINIIPRFEGTVYNLKVQYDESYLVHGRAVHNCSFEMGQEGALYAKYIDKMRLDGRIGVVPWEPYHKVHTSWDLGIADPTCIIFFQVIGEIVRVIDYYEQSDRSMDHFARVIQEKEYVYGKHFPPHDIMARESARGLTKKEMYKELGISFTEPVQIDIQDGIELVRRTFSKMWIDERKCAKLIKALENYRYEWDDKLKRYKSRPLHDWSSHASDSMRYMCAALPKCRTGTSPEDLDKRYREAMYGSNSNMPNVFRDDVGY
jgi:hypothetical protein